MTMKMMMMIIILVIIVMMIIITVEHTTYEDQDVYDLEVRGNG